jgi:hypothetical protein
MHIWKHPNKAPQYSYTGDHREEYCGKKCKTLSKKQLKQRRAGDVAQVVVCLPSKCEALSSNLSTTKITNIKYIIKDNAKIKCTC